MRTRADGLSAAAKRPGQARDRPTGCFGTIEGRPSTGDCGRRADAPNTVFAKGTRGSKVSNVTESIDLVLNIVPLASGRLCITNDGMPTCLRNACDALEKR